MTQFEHTFIATILSMFTAILLKEYLIFPEEYEYWENWFNK